LETPERPDPEALLARARHEAAQAARGRLKVFLGAAPGVGKTYAMLEAARLRHREGLDVRVGVVETHGRIETEALAQGLEKIPLRAVEYNGLLLRELDLDSCLTRHPRLLLVDELAHTNAPGSRHTKRWQDVRELLDAGIDVYTTLNVQHVESLHDVVRQITGIEVRETVPDRVLESADEVELVDLPPDELTQRLRAGKVYLGEQAARAEDHFFREGNLIALRELALRFTAQRVDAQMETYRRERGIETPWPAGERILVCIGPSPRSSGLLRAARRMASALRTVWYAVVVETPGMRTLTRADRERLEAHLRQAEEMGAEPVRLSGESVAHELLAFARRKNVARILIGKPSQARFRDRLRDRIRGSLLDALVRASQGVDVLVVDAAEEAPEWVAPLAVHRAGWGAYLTAAGCVLAATGISSLVRSRLDLADVAMIFVLGIVVASLRTSLGPSVLASFLSILSYDYFFVPPYYTFAVDDLKHLLSFGVMLWVGLVISTLVARIRSEVEGTRDRARRTAELYALSRDLGAMPGREEIAENLCRRMRELFPLEIALLVPGAGGRLESAEPGHPEFIRDAKERSVAQWAFDLEQRAGRGTETLAGARALYLPMRGPQSVVGILAALPLSADPPNAEALLPFAQLGALALERARLSEEARSAQLAAETEALRSSLLSSVSHDLRTPLAVISAAAGSLLAPGAGLDEAARSELLSDIHAEASQLSRLIENLLDMTRVEAGGLELRREWCSWEEIVGSALNRVERQLGDRPIAVTLPAELPLVSVDAVLMETVLVNLLENAVRYTPPDSPLEIGGAALEDVVEVWIGDRGPGLPPGTTGQVFDRFFRGQAKGRGFGLGLAIVKGIVEAHGGSVSAENRNEGGALFRVRLPNVEPPSTTPTPVE